MSDSEWLEYQQDERRRASAALAAAADQFNAVRGVEDRLREQGRDHLADPGCLMAVRKFEQLVVDASAHGFDVQLISDEATRRRR